MKTLLLLIMLFFQSNLHSKEVVKLTNKKNVYNVTSYMEILEDPELNLKLSDVLNTDKKKLFKPIDVDTINLGYTNSAYWFKLRVFNKNRSKPAFLEIPWPHIDYLDVYILNEKDSSSSDSKPGDDVFISYKSGRMIPYNQRDYEHRNFLFKLPNIPGGEEFLIYIRVQSDETISFPVFIYDEIKFFNKDHSEEFIFGVYYGIVFIMFFYNLFIYLSTRDLNYFIYLFYVMSLGLYQLSMNGIIFSYWPDYPRFNKVFLPFSSVLLQLILTILFKNMLNLGEKYKWEKRVLDTLIVVNLLSLIAVISLDYSKVIAPINIIGFFYMLASMLIVVRSVIDGNRTAIFFLITWITFLAGGIILVLRNFNVLPQNFITNYSLQLGSTIEMVLLSLALADKINTMKKELQVLNTHLEEKVQGRTIELTRVLEILQNKNKTIESELELASDIQKCIFPEINDDRDFIRFSGYYEYLMKVGGDFYDILHMPDNALGVLIADVSGHGIPAALLSTMYKISFMDAARKTLSPTEIFKEVNDNISGIMNTHDYMTAFMLIIFPDGRLKYSCAAHRPAFLYRKKKKKIEVITTRGLFLGMLPNASQTFEEKEDRLENGDKILLFTDGVIDAFNENEERWHTDQLLEAFEKCVELELDECLEFVKTEWRKFKNSRPINDDSTLLLIEYNKTKKKALKTQTAGV